MYLMKDTKTTLEREYSVVDHAIKGKLGLNSTHWEHPRAYGPWMDRVMIGGAHFDPLDDPELPVPDHVRRLWIRSALRLAAVVQLPALQRVRLRTGDRSGVASRSAERRPSQRSEDWACRIARCAGSALVRCPCNPPLDRAATRRGTCPAVQCTPMLSWTGTRPLSTPRTTAIRDCRWFDQITSSFRSDPIFFMYKTTPGD